MHKNEVKPMHSIKACDPNFENLKSPVAHETRFKSTFEWEGVDGRFEDQPTLVLSPSFNPPTYYISQSLKTATHHGNNYTIYTSNATTTGLPQNSFTSTGW